ncbi:MAG: hypothetical protein ACTSSI_08655 [Candidatus Helarchaeota archaeon]
MGKAKKAKKPKKTIETTSTDTSPSTSGKTISVGDKILINTVIKKAENGEVIDTTLKDLAQKAGIFDERHRYGPQFIVVGEKFVFDEVDHKLTEMKVGEKREFELENPFGKRDPKNIKMYSIREFKRANIDVKKSMGRRVTFKGRSGYIISERGGRVRIDYNHPLADQKILFEVEIVKKLEDQQELVNQILEMNFQGINLEKVEINFEEKKISIKLPMEVALQQNAAYGKFGVYRYITEYLKDIEEIEFREVFTRDFMKPPASDTETSEKPSESSETSAESENDKKQGDESS